MSLGNGNAVQNLQNYVEMREGKVLNSLFSKGMYKKHWRMKIKQFSSNNAEENNLNKLRLLFFCYVICISIKYN